MTSEWKGDRKGGLFSFASRSVASRFLFFEPLGLDFLVICRHSVMMYSMS